MIPLAFRRRHTPRPLGISPSAYSEMCARKHPRSWMTSLGSCSAERQFLFDDISEHADGEHRGACARSEGPQRRAWSRPFRCYSRICRSPSAFAVGMVRSPWAFRRRHGPEADLHSGRDFEAQTNRSEQLVRSSGGFFFSEPCRGVNGGWDRDRRLVIAGPRSSTGMPFR